MNVVFVSVEISEITHEKISDLKIALENDFKIKYDDLKLLLFEYEDIISFVKKTSRVIIEDLESRKLR